MRRRWLWLIPAAACAVLALAGGILVYRSATRPEEPVAALAGTAEDSGEERVVWEGREYVRKDSVVNYLFLGIDSREKASVRVGSAGAGQSDALFLFSWDRESQELTVISIPRDTLTQMEVFGAEGESLGQTEDHISLAYAYGDGSHRSCELSVQAVSNLFYGLDILKYCSVSMDAIPAAVEQVPGVEVEVPNDSLAEAYPELAQGTRLEITPENAEIFVRYRDIGESQSAVERLERQQVFLQAYGGRLQELYQEDAGTAADLYLALEPYMVTNISKGELLQMVEDMSQGSIRQWTVPGQGREAGSYDEYVADDAALYEAVIETFYTEAAS